MSKLFNVKKEDDNGEMIYVFRKIIEKYHWNFYETSDLYNDWHNDRYLRQCLFNLQEKYDCGGIPEEEWKIIQENFNV